MKDCQLLAVVTQPDRPLGRQQILTPPPIKILAQEHKIKIIDSDIMIRIIRAVKEASPDVGVLAAYGKIIPKELIDLFPKGILIIHPSLLPAYRGASPVQAAILKGDKKTGVTIIKMDEKMDHGPIIAQFTELINPEDTTETLRTRLFKMASDVLIAILPAWVERRIEPRQQNHNKATYTWLLKKEDGFIPPKFLNDALEWKPSHKPWPIRFMGNLLLSPNPYTIERFIRAMTPWPGAFTNVKLEANNEKFTRRLKILKAHLESIQDRKPKTILDRNRLAKLVLDQVQLEGKRPVSWEEFKRGYQEFKLG